MAPGLGISWTTDMGGVGASGGGRIGVDVRAWAAGGLSGRSAGGRFGRMVARRPA
ncbi:hypothetical protein [Alsobacter sp. SYSU BS001988]